MRRFPRTIRPRKDQPFYHLLAENMESSYVAYVSQQNLVPDDSDEPVDHPAISGLFNDLCGRPLRAAAGAPPLALASTLTAGIALGGASSRRGSRPPGC